jgi:hypothetical protein
MTTMRGGMWMVAMLLFVTVGCRTTQPVLKPDKQPEVLNVPPQEARFNTSTYPKMAFEDSSPKNNPALNKDGVMPTRGAMGGMPGGAGAPGGMSGR